MVFSIPNQLPGEQWKFVSSGSADFYVSSFARVAIPALTKSYMRGDVLLFQKRKARLVSPWLGNNGYLYVSQKIGANRTKHLLHRLVARAFVDGEFDGATVNHIDGRKINNLPANLEWVTRSENTRLQWESGLIDIRGDKNPNVKLSDKDIPMVFLDRASGRSVADIADRLQVSTALIYKVLKGTKRARRDV